jgi:lytic murein transglycosylase
MQRMQRMFSAFSLAILLAIVLVARPPAVHAEGGGTPATCKNTVPFEKWLAEFKREAAAQMISQSAINAASPYLTYEQRIINIDRGQRVFGQTFIDFSTKRVNSRLGSGRAAIKRHQDLFRRIDKDYGVPASVITAFWGLETDYGSTRGKDHVLRALATLAYDCRRGELFRPRLFDALRIIERGDLRASEMLGSWAGEIGQAQMMASEYYKSAVDYDGDGRRDLINSVPDVLASTANFIGQIGWKRGQPWLQEVRVPANLPWEQADASIYHPRSKWAEWGVKSANGPALASDALPAALVLPMGRLGPAFLAYENFKIYTEWNNSLIYALTAAYFATRLDGAPAIQTKAGRIPSLGGDDIRELQRLLAKRGFDVGRIDGILGLKTRQAVREMQIKFKLPADAWPTTELLTRLRQGR